MYKAKPVFQSFWFKIKKESRKSVDQIVDAYLLRKYLVDTIYIKKLIRAKCTRLSLDEAKTTAAEFRTLSVYLQRGNGRILINRDIQYCEEVLVDEVNDS